MAFTLVLPLTTAVTQVVMLVPALFVGIPAHLMEVVRRVPAADLEQAYRTGCSMSVVNSAFLLVRRLVAGFAFQWRSSGENRAGCHFSQCRPAYCLACR